MGTDNYWSRHRLKCATQAEILRAHQRDDDFVKHLRDKLSETLQNFSAHSALSRCVQSDIPFKLLYFVFTSGMGNQTLGEEYTGIVQADLEARRVPTLTVRSERNVYHAREEHSSESCIFVNPLPLPLNLFLALVGKGAGRNLGMLR